MVADIECYPFSKPLDPAPGRCDQMQKLVLVFVF